jgi:hypothetical protein
MGSLLRYKPPERRYRSVLCSSQRVDVLIQELPPQAASRGSGGPVSHRV